MRPSRATVSGAMSAPGVAAKACRIPLAGCPCALEVIEELQEVRAGGGIAGSDVSQ